jgi:hypothetical protein
VSAGAFAVALLGDLLDVAAHVVVVVGLLHTHFQVRPLAVSLPVFGFRLVCSCRTNGMRLA